MPCAVRGWHTVVPPFFLFVPLVRTLSQGAHFFQMVKTFAIPSVGRPDKLTRELVRSAETWGPPGPIASASGL